MIRWSWEKANGAEENMARDCQMLESGCHIRFYSWRAPAITLGYSQHPNEWVNLIRCHDLGVEVAQRPTGGGVVFHNRDLSWSISAPHSELGLTSIQQCYQKIHEAVASGIKKRLGLPLYLAGCQEAICSDQPPSFCFAVPVGYDIMIASKKLAGGAIRWTKKMILYQGTLLVVRDFSLLQEVVLSPKRSWLKSLTTSSISLRELKGDSWEYEDVIFAILEGLQKNLGWVFEEDSTREMRHLWTGNRRSKTGRYP